MSDAANYYLVTTTSADSSVYTSLVDAMAALQSLVQLQRGRGYESQRNPSGRYISEHPDLPAVLFWVTDESGDIVS